MKTTALIVEYNPFHNGHQYHLQKSREITGNDDLIVIMSGNFTQRGDAAILDKWARTKQALSCGVDLVLELPFVYDIRSAEYFAHYSVLSLEKTNLVDSIVFGSEAGDLELLSAAAEALTKESPAFKKSLQNYLKNGLDFPTARAKALLNTYQDFNDLAKFNAKKIEKVLAAPNNILAIEYLKSLFKLDSKIKAYTIKRMGTNYHSQEINKNYASASLIRNLFNNRNQKEALQAVKKLMPEPAWSILKKEVELGRYVKNSSQKQIIVKTIDQIRRLQAEDLTKYNGINNGLENRFINTAAAEFKAESFLEALKAKNLTESRIKRKILQLYFSLDTAKIELVENNAPHYLRVLGVKKGKEYLLSKLQAEAEAEVIINPAEKINEINIQAEAALELSLSYDLLASDLYALLYENQKHSQSHRDFHQRLIKIY
jgi:predicted nucleotidyltransferase